MLDAADLYGCIWRKLRNLSLEGKERIVLREN